MPVLLDTKDQLQGSFDAGANAVDIVLEGDTIAFERQFAPESAVRAAIEAALKK